MKHEQIVNDVISSLEKRNWERLNAQLADNFTFSGTVSQPLKKNEWVGVQRAIQSGMPDLRFNLHQVIAKGDKVMAKVKLSGTHSKELPATPPVTNKPIPSTGKKVELPEEEVEFSFEGDKISKFYVKPVAHGGVNGILEQLNDRKEMRTDYLE
jgi:predicted ester cyclase